MIMMKRRSMVALPLAMAVALGRPALAAADPVKWDLATNNPATNYQVTTVQQFAQAVTAATGSLVTINVAAGGMLGFKGPDMLAALRDGLVPIGTMLLNQQVGLSPLLGTSSLPFLVSGFDEMRTFYALARPVFEKDLARFNQKLLYVVPWPGQNVFSKAESIGPASFKSMKIRTVDRIGSDFFRTLGAAPVQIPWGEVVPALATGVIDSVTTSTSSAIDGQFWEFMKNCTVVNWQSNFEAISVNLDAWNAIPPDSQAKIEAVAKRLEPNFWDVAKAEDSGNFKTLQSKAMTVKDASPELRAYMLDKAKASWAAFEATVPPAKPLLQQYLQAVGK
jgi:TRAP-type C4-dicarboxylate transport system substrate-binding protein